MNHVRAAGERHRAARSSRDWSKIFVLPTVGKDGEQSETPEGMRLPLYEYQKRSLARMVRIEEDGRIMLPRGAPGSEVEFVFRGGVIADEVGMGKTAQLIALFLARPGTAGQPQNLVVTPGHLCTQWANEIRKFAPSLRVATIETAATLGHNARSKVETGSMNHDVVITSLEVILGASEGQAALFGLSWRRIVYDECHEVIALSDPQRQSMLENLARRSRNVWCVSGTPFPHHDASMYGIHQLLGVKYKMHIVDSPFARNTPLSENHPFQMIKRRFYLKNTPASVGSEWEKIGGKFKFRVRTTWLDMTLTERGFYDEQYRKLQAKNGYGPMFIPLRQLCDHPAACKDWADALQHGGPNQPLHTLEDLRARFIEQKEKELERMAGERARIKEHQEAARHATSIVKQLSSVVQGVQREDIEVSGGLVTYPPGNPNYRIVNQNGAVSLRRRHVLKQWLLSDMRTYEARQHFLNLTSHWLGVSADNLERLAKEETAVRKELEYFQTVLKELEPEATAQSTSAVQGDEEAAETAAAAPEGAGAISGAASAPERECIICSGTDMSIVSMAPCGHYFCTTCLQKWLVDHSDCPTCRQPISRNDVMWIHLSLTRNAATSNLTRRFGTKPAALVQFIQAELAADANSRFIVFSMWHSMLKLTQNTLEANGIQVTMCDSKTDAENAKAIELFRTSPTTRIIMLSMEHAAAGTNLQAANHVILLEPPGVNPAHGVAQETQAIGRAARLGQERVINITRFVIKDTIESELHKHNHDQRMASESGRRFACDTSDEQLDAPPSAAAGTATPATISVVCAITRPDPGCFEVGGASALPAQHTEPIVLTTAQPADRTATVGSMRASFLELARQRMPSLSPGCTLALYFAGQQLMDTTSDHGETKIVDHNIQTGSRLHGVLRPAVALQAHDEDPTQAATSASAYSEAKTQGARASLGGQTPAAAATVMEEHANAQSPTDSLLQTSSDAEVDDAQVEDEDDHEEEERLTIDEIDNMRVVELRAELKSRGLLASGRRPALLSRLKGHVSTRTTSARKRRHADDNSSPIFTPHGTPGAESTAVVETSSSRKRMCETSERVAEAPAEEAAAAATETVAGPSAASSAAPVGSRHCDRETALRNVIAMGFTPQRAARLQKQAASPGSDGIGDTEKLIAVLLGEPAAAVAPQRATLDAVPTASAEGPATVAETVTMDLTQEDYVPSRPQVLSQPGAALRRSGTVDLVAGEAPAAHNNVGLAPLVTMDLTQEEDYVPSQPQVLSQPAAALRRSGTVALVAGEAPAAHNNVGLAQLAEMGFSGSVAERALKAAGGDVQEALSRLLYRASVL